MFCLRHLKIYKQSRNFVFIQSKNNQNKKCSNNVKWKEKEETTDDIYIKNILNLIIVRSWGETHKEKTAKIDARQTEKPMHWHTIEKLRYLKTNIEEKHILIQIN